MSSQSSASGSKRKCLVRPTSENLLHPGEWGNKRARTGSPSASGAESPAGHSNSPACSNPSSTSPSPMGRPGSPDIFANTSVPLPNAGFQASGSMSGIIKSSKSSKGSAWAGLEQALGALRITAKICPPLSLAVDELVSCLPMFEAAARNHKDYGELSTSLEGMVNQLVRHFKGTISEAIKATITSIANAIRKEIETINVQQSRSLPRRMLEASSTEDDLMRRYRRIEQLFRQLQGEASMSTWDTVDKLRIEQQLKDLRPSKLARFNSELSTEVSRRGCTRRTRTKILDDSTTWSEDPDLAKVYWMNGMAGTGKTTIAYTLCERLEAGKQLAASFFCTSASPDCREAKRIIPTIAYQLARRFTPFRYSLCQQLEEDPDISSGQLSDQFKQLLKEPLLAVKDKLSDNLVIVVDALDECSDPHIVELFLDLLLRSAEELPIRFFVTSRPEPAIRNKMMPESERSRSILYLHEIERSLVQNDIKLYLGEELASIAPADEDITELAEHAGNLFIYAATAVRHIRPVGKAVNSKARLKAILAVGTESTAKLSAIDALYAAILSDAFDDQDLSPEERNQMRLVLHTAICACEPILIRTLSALSGLEDNDDTIAALQPLRSVLHVSDHSELVTTLHASFPDFMFDPMRSGAFYCDTADHSCFLSEMCFRVMNAQLRFNICSIQSSFIPNNQVPGLGEQIDANISEELFYTCRFWVDHLSQTDARPALLPPLDEFISQRLLFWMEVMSLKSCMMPGMLAMTRLVTWLTQVDGETFTNLLQLATDAQAFVAMYASSPASAYTPHIYISTLPLVSPSSSMRTQYLPQYKGLIKVSGTSFDKIGKATLDIWASKRSIRSSALSSDGNRIVLGDENGGISVLSSHNGNYVFQPFKAHKKPITSLAISGDGMKVVAGSSDMSLSVWSIQHAYGRLIAGPFKGHKGRVNSVDFSFNGALIVSGSDDCAVGVWDSRNVAAPMTLLMGHKKEVQSVAFSPDGSHIASGSADHTIRVWDVSSRITILILKGHSATVALVTFSPSGAHIVSGSNDRSICIWNTSDGTLSRRPLKGHSGQITSVAMSPDGDRIVSSSRDRSIRVWDIHSGKLVAGPFEGHTQIIRSVSFLGDSVRIISTSEDKTVRVWNASNQVPQIDKDSKSGVRRDTILASLSQTHIAFCDQKDLSKIHVWDLRVMRHVVIPTGTDINHLQLSADGCRIHSLHTGAPKTLCTWDTQTAKLLDGPFRCSMLHEWDSTACSVDGTRVVFCHESRATLWHVQSNQCIMLCETRRPYSQLRAAFSQDGSRIVTFDTNRSEVWDAETGTHVITSGLFRGGDACLSSNGTYLCCGSFGSYQLANINTGQQITLCSDSTPVFTPDGLHVAGKGHIGYFTGIYMKNMLGQEVNSVHVPSTWDELRQYTILGCSSDGQLLLSHNRKEGCNIYRTRINRPPCTLRPDGWMLNHQKQPMFWVPAEIREAFPVWTGVNLSECDEVSLRVDYDDMLVGDDWDQCYVPDACLI